MCLLLKAVWERRFTSQVQKFDTVTSENSESGVFTEAVDFLAQTVTLYCETQAFLIIILNDVRHVLIVWFNYEWKHYRKSVLLNSSHP